MIAGWGGLRFADFLKAYPPMPGAKWARLDSSVNLDRRRQLLTRIMSLLICRRPGTRRRCWRPIKTSESQIPLTVEHGAPLRLIVPMKLGLKNIKAITKITYTERSRKITGARRPRLFPL